MSTQAELAAQLIQQLRVLDPSASAEIGTPERKLIDTFAQGLAENEISLDQLNSALDLDSKSGSDLDAFLSIFRFGRQTGAPATGFVTFSRVTVSNYLIPIPPGTQVASPSTSVSLIFTTTAYTEIPIGQTSAIAPIQCTQIGTIGNVATGTITDFAAAPVVGVTSVTNEVPTTGGSDLESDDEFKVRFRNTVFRNLAGTQDQYLALAIATQFTTKANAVGPISRYREYIQIPDVDDASNDPDSGLSGSGNANEWTTALSTIPYSKHIYDKIPYFVSDGANTGTTFFRRDTDFKLNKTNAARNRGDTARSGVDLTDSSYDFEPNLTFLNILNPSAAANVQGLRPGDIAYFEHSYMSDASRNDYGQGILNCVDVYINGSNLQVADAIIPRPSGTGTMFVSNPLDPFYVENFRRVSESEHRPVIGNLFTGLFWEPTMDLPDKITTSDAIYLKGIHYWAVEDVSEIGGTVRTRSGIEWSVNLRGRASNDPTHGPYTGPKITATADQQVKINNYLYDRNIVDLQVALEAEKQVTTDVLAHQAKLRYFKVDVTAMLVSGFTPGFVNSAVAKSLDNFYKAQYFGSTIQLSDLLVNIHNGAVDNVRWSKELLTGNLDSNNVPRDNQGEYRDRVVECDVTGRPLVTAQIDRKTPGTASGAEIHQMYLTGAPETGHLSLVWDGNETDDIPVSGIDATAITTAFSAASIPATVTSGSGTPTSPWIITFSSNGFRSEVISINEANNTMHGPDFIFNTDYFLKDNELPALPTGMVAGDSAPGVILRKRAQNVWNAL